MASRRFSPLTSLALGLYGATATLLTPVIKGHLAKRQRRGKEHPTRLPERLGKSDRARPDGTLIWIHGASVGESLSILPLIEELNRQQDGLSFLVTTGTTTSARLMEIRLPENAIHQFVPVDLPQAVERFLSHWRPDLGLMVESELWPQLITRSRNRGIPLLLLNARMSKGSLSSWQRAPFLIGDLLSCFTTIFAQSRQDAEHYRELGADDVREEGNLKFAAPPLGFEEAEAKKLREEIGERPVWLASSTHPGEEHFLAEIHKALLESWPDLLCIIAPRHPERGGDIQEELGDLGLISHLRSSGQRPTPATQLYIADTLGELGLWYHLSPIVVIGGSLLRKGGQNLLEPARQDCAVICGPEMQNFQAITDAMRDADAIRQLSHHDDLSKALQDLLQDEAARQGLANRGKAYVTAKGEEIHELAAQILKALP